MSLDTILNIMSKHQLTADELLLIYLTFIAQTENGDPDKNRIYFKRWYDGGGNKQLKSLFESLKLKGIILKNYNPKSYSPDEIEFNKNFIKSYFKLSGELGQELWKHYPANMFLNGKVVSLKNFTKSFITLDELYFHYAKTIGHNLQKHQEIIEILDWAKKNDLVTIGIVEFISSRKWEEYQQLRINGIQNRSETYDIYSE